MEKRFDFIIVGAGSAGCVLANRLSADDRCSVLLLEAGGANNRPLMRMPLAWRDTYRDPTVSWGYFSEPEPFLEGRRVPALRGKVLGGSSSVNGMLYARGCAADYDHWRQLGAAGWSYAEVLPYFRRSETNWRGESEHHGGDGLVAVSRCIPDEVIHPALVQTAMVLGYSHLDDFHGAEADGFGIPDFTISKGRRVSAATAFLGPALRRANLTVEAHALVHRVLLEKGRAIGVEYERGGVLTRVYAEREVILSGGAFNSPQLLLLSGIGPADDLRAMGLEVNHNLPGVGKNLQDHHAIGALFATRGLIGFERCLRLDRLAIAAIRWRLFGTGPVASVPISLQGFYRSMPGLPQPDVQFLVSPVSMSARPWFPGWRKGEGSVLSSLSVLLNPASTGEVTLRSADPRDSPKIRFNLLKDPADRSAFRRLVRFTQDFFATRPAADLVGHPIEPAFPMRTDDEIDAYVRRAVGAAMHPTSSCAMGTGPEAVLDAECRIRGIDGLRVIDASVMPRIVGGNTNAPVIMIAEKAADMILGAPPLPPAQV